MNFHTTTRAAEPDSQRLLVLDDDAAAGETICRIARVSGTEARYTSNPEQFFRGISSWNPDVLAVDLMMPGKDGVEVMAELANLDCKADIIITSGVGERVLDAASRSASEKGLRILGILPKPFTTTQLRSLLKSTAHAPAGSGETADSQTLSEFTDEDLAAAIERREISLALQPKFRCTTGTLAGFEALARWRHPRHGDIPPARFIARAEQLELIDAITRIVADRALHWLSSLDTDGLPENTASYLKSQTTLSINLSALSLGQSELFDWLADRCRTYEIAPERVILEITESSAMKDPVRSLETLTRLRLQGFRLSIDDFGTGFSSMLQLVRLPFSEIKVDKTFVIQAAQSAESRAVIRSVIDLGHSLGLTATAEGVEDEQSLNFLKECRCDQVQGFLLARPLASDQVLPWLITREQRREQERVDALRATGHLDSETEARFDRITRLASRVFRVPVALIALADSHRQFFKSVIGVPVREIPRNHAFCDWTLAGDDLLVVPDALQDERFRNLPGVRGEPGYRFYAGRPICLPGGQKAGTLCLIDLKPRELSQEQEHLFNQFADMAENELAVTPDQSTDGLTGLPDRLAFRSQITLGRDISNRLGCRSALIIVTLNNLGDINRQQGRETGNRMIHEMGEILKQLGAQADLMGRYRGNEFGVMLIDADQQRVNDFCDYLTRAVDQRNRRRAGASGLHCHIGLVWFNQTHQELDTETAVEQARQRILTIIGRD